MQPLLITKIGANILQFHERPHVLRLNNIFYVPKIAQNLLSISQLTRDNLIYVEFYSNYYDTKDLAMMKELARGMLSNGL